MKRILLFVLIVLVFQTVGAQDDFIWGAFDPFDMLDSPEITVEHIFLFWNQDTQSIYDAIAAIVAEGKQPMITLEPTSWNGYNGLTDATLLQDIATGWYDDVITEDCQVFRQFAPQNILLRWGHEMELDGLFAWSQGNPDAFILAYRYFVTACRDIIGATNVQFMWSPAGNADALDYYPGDEYVDFVGLTVLGYEEWDIRFDNAQTWRSFNELFWRRYELVEPLNKPVIVAELGVCCGVAHQREWLTDAYYAMGESGWYPLLVMAVYFNDMNPTQVWAPGLVPDWRVTSDLFPHIVS